MTLRLVLDTNVIVAAVTSAHGASRRLLLAAAEGRVTMLLSTPLLLEYAAVLNRPGVLAMAGATPEDISALLDGIVDLSTQVLLDYRWRPQARDPDDDMVLETAINGSAAVIASFNVADIQAGARRFGIAVERPGTVERRLGG